MIWMCLEERQALAWGSVCGGWLAHIHTYLHIHKQLRIRRAGYLFVVFPCLTGALFMVIISLVCNNLDTHRVYPLCASDVYACYSCITHVRLQSQ